MVFVVTFWVSFVVACVVRLYFPVSIFPDLFSCFAFRWVSFCFLYYVSNIVAFELHE